MITLVVGLRVQQLKPSAFTYKALQRNCLVLL